MEGKKIKLTIVIVFYVVANVGRILVFLFDSFSTELLRMDPAAAIVNPLFAYVMSEALGDAVRHILWPRCGVSIIHRAQQ